MEAGGRGVGVEVGESWHRHIVISTAAASKIEKPIPIGPQ